MAKKDATEDENSKQPSVNVETGAGTNETNIHRQSESSEQHENSFTKPDTHEVDENSPKLDLILAQHSKKSKSCDINIENDTDSSMKGPADDVSNRSLGEIFSEKAMFDTSHESGPDPYNILRTDKLPSDLESVSSIIFPALGPEIGANVGTFVSLSTVTDDKISQDNQEITESGDAEENVQRVEIERKQTSNVYMDNSGSGIHHEKGKDELRTNETIEISDLSQEDHLHTPEKEIPMIRYTPLPGNKDTIMVDFSKPSSASINHLNERNELQNIASQYASKEDVDTQNYEETTDNNITNSSTAADNISANLQSTSIDLAGKLNETFIQPVSNGNELLLDSTGNLKHIVYQETFTGENITSVIAAASNTSKNMNTVGIDCSDDGTINSSINVVEKSTTESTSNEADNSTDITGTSDANPNSTTTDSNVQKSGHGSTANTTETGDQTSNDGKSPIDGQKHPEHSDLDNDENDEDHSIDDTAAPLDEFSNEDELLGGQSDNLEQPIDADREKALLANSSSNSADELSDATADKKKKTLLSSKMHDRKRKKGNVNVISSEGDQA